MCVYVCVYVCVLRRVRVGAEQASVGVRALYIHIIAKYNEHIIISILITATPVNQCFFQVDNRLDRSLPQPAC